MLPEWLAKTLDEIEKASSVAGLVGLLERKQKEILKFFGSELCNFKNPAVPNYGICEVDDGLKALAALLQRAQEKASQLKKPSSKMQKQFDDKCGDLNLLKFNIQRLWDLTSDLTIFIREQRFREQRFGSDCFGLGRILGLELDPAVSGRTLWQKLWHRGIKNPVIREMMDLVPLSEGALPHIVELNSLLVGKSEFARSDYQKLIGTIKDKMVDPRFISHFNGLTEEALYIACSLDNALTIFKLRYEGAVKSLAKIECAFDRIRGGAGITDVVGEQGMEFFRPGINKVLKDLGSFNEIVRLYNSLDKGDGILGGNTSAVKKGLRERYEKMAAAIPDLEEGFKQRLAELAPGEIDRLKAAAVMTRSPVVVDETTGESTGTALPIVSEGQSATPLEKVAEVVVKSLPMSSRVSVETIVSEPKPEPEPEPVAPPTPKEIPVVESDAAKPAEPPQVILPAVEAVEKTAPAVTETEGMGKEAETRRRVRDSVAGNPALAAMAAMFRGKGSSVVVPVSPTKDVVAQEKAKDSALEQFSMRYTHCETGEQFVDMLCEWDQTFGKGEHSDSLTKELNEVQDLLWARYYAFRLRELLAVENLDEEHLEYVREAYFFFYNSVGEMTRAFKDADVYDGFNELYDRIERIFDLETGVRKVLSQEEMRVEIKRIEAAIEEGVVTQAVEPVILKIVKELVEATVKVEEKPPVASTGSPSKRDEMSGIAPVLPLVAASVTVAPNAAFLAPPKPPMVEHPKTPQDEMRIKIGSILQGALLDKFINGTFTQWAERGSVPEKSALESARFVLMGRTYNLNDTQVNAVIAAAQEALSPKDMPKPSC